jgi:hypothetical protein
MSEVICPACGSDVTFREINYGRAHEHCEGFCCSECGGIGLKMRSEQQLPVFQVTYPALIPFGAMSRVRFVLAEQESESFTFVSRKSRHVLDQALIEQLDKPEPDLVAEFH